VKSGIAEPRKKECLTKDLLGRGYRTREKKSQVQSDQRETPAGLASEKRSEIQTPKTRC
jgi:hypothetical protein